MICEDSPYSDVLGRYVIDYAVQDKVGLDKIQPLYDKVYWRISIGVFY